MTAVVNASYPSPEAFRVDCLLGGEVVESGDKDVKTTTSDQSTLSAKLSVHSEAPPLMGEVVVDRVIPSDSALVTPLVVRTVDFLIEEGVIHAESEQKIQLCLMEGLRNAVVHGNGSDFSKQVRLRVFAGDDELGVLIENEGEGFDPTVALDSPPEDTVWEESGRGLHILAHYMDRLEYYSGGRALLLRKAQKSA